MQSDYSKGHDLKNLRFLLNLPALIYLRITVTLLLSPYGDCPLNVAAPSMLIQVCYKSRSLRSTLVPHGADLAPSIRA
jgi:hypothetical protein